MAEYRLTPDELIAKDFRLIKSSRRGYHPYGRSDWVTTIRTVYKKTGNVIAGFLQDEYPHVYVQGVWIYGNWDKALCAAGFKSLPLRQTFHLPGKALPRFFWFTVKSLCHLNQLFRVNSPAYAQFWFTASGALVALTLTLSYVTY
jgi:hypothetical protein